MTLSQCKLRTKRGICIIQQPGYSELRLRSAKPEEVPLNKKAHGNTYVEICGARGAERAGDFHTLGLQYSKDEVPRRGIFCRLGLVLSLFSFFTGFKRKHLFSGSSTVYPALRGLEGLSHRLRRLMAWQILYWIRAFSTWGFGRLCLKIQGRQIKKAP